MSVDTEDGAAASSVHCIKTCLWLQKNKIYACENRFTKIRYPFKC